MDYKKITILLLLTIILILFPSNVFANTIVYDSFSNGYNQELWVIEPGQQAPIISDFGIKVNPDYSSYYASLLLSKELPKSLLIRVKMKIHSNEPSDMGIFIKNTNTNEWKNAFLFGIGNGGEPHSAILRDSSIWSDPSKYIRGTWNESIGIHTFELYISGEANSFIQLVEDNNLLLEWDSALDFSINQIHFGIFGTDSEFSDFEICDENICTTVSPTPSVPKKVIIVPGLGGSWNKDALTGCKSDNYEGSWSDWAVAEWNIYEPLYERLIQDGYQPSIMYYDWRWHVNKTARALDSYISERIREDETVDIVGHSLGGLVSTAYIEQKKENHSLDKMVTVGTPHAGSVFAYPAWSGGEIWLEDPRIRIGFTVMNVMCGIKRGWSPKQTIQQLAPSIQNLLPIHDYLMNKNGSYIPVSTMHAQNNWLPSRLTPPFFDVAVASFAGNGYQTLKSIQVQKNVRIVDRLFGNWRDGKPNGSNTYADGDGTVLTESSFLHGAYQKTLPLSHSGLITDVQGTDAILEFLNGTYIAQPPTSLLHRPENLPVFPEKDITALVVIVDGATATLTDKDGNTYGDSDGQITILNPYQEEYTLRIKQERNTRRKSTYTIYVIQMYEDGTHSWKKYDKRHERIKALFKIRFGKKHAKSMIEEN